MSHNSFQLRLRSALANVLLSTPIAGCMSSPAASAAQQADDATNNGNGNGNGTLSVDKAKAKRLGSLISAWVRSSSDPSP